MATENKRFKFFRGEGRTPMIYDNKMEKYYFCVDLDILSDLLNEQHETIENLKDANVRCCNEYHYFHKRMMKLEKENEQLKLQNENLKSNVDDLLNLELEDKHTVCMAGKFRLDEWGKHRLHQFYKGDEELEDESVVIMLMDLENENEQLKQYIKEMDDAELHLKQIILKRIDDYIWEWEDEGTLVAQVLKELRDEIKGDV